MRWSKWSLQSINKCSRTESNCHSSITKCRCKIISVPETQIFGLETLVVVVLAINNGLQHRLTRNNLNLHLGCTSSCNTKTSNKLSKTFQHSRSSASNRIVSNHNPRWIKLHKCIRFNLKCGCLIVKVIQSIWEMVKNQNHSSNKMTPALWWHLNNPQNYSFLSSRSNLIRKICLN